MAGKGGSSHLARLAAPRFMPIARKEHAWLVRPIPGAHRLGESVSLLTLIKDILKLADNTREAKRIIRDGGILIDGRAIKREKFPVGVMDVVSIPALGKHFRIAVDNKERIRLAEIGGERARFKLCRVMRKTTAPGNRVQVGLHDGRNVLAENKFRIGDTVKLAVPDQRIIETLRLGPEARCLVMKGKHAGQIAKVTKLHPRTSRRAAEATLQSDGSEFTTVQKYLFVVGDEL